MDFIAFADGVIKDERYREVEEPAKKLLERYRKPFKPSYKQSILALGSRLLQDTEAPFVADPKEVVFSNFEVEGTYEKTVRLTNTTAGLCTFRVLPVSPQWSDVLSVEYTVPPRICAGLSWSINVKFTPRNSEDIKTDIRLKTEIGVVRIPIQATTQKTHFRFSPSAIDFGTVSVGERAVRTMAVENKGAAPGRLLLSGSFLKLTEKLHLNPTDGKEYPFFSFAPLMYRVDIPPFSKKVFEVVFSPYEEAALDCSVVFSGGPQTSVETIIPIHGSSTGVPVYVSSPDVDFLWCFWGCKYSAEVVVANQSTVSAIVRPEVPAELADVLVLQPKQVCVQPMSDYRMLLHFAPVEGLPEDFETVINIRVHGQSFPAHVRVKAQLTPREPELSSTELTYGSCFVNREEVVVLDVTNPSSLPQMLGFLDIPENVLIVPDTLTLLPKETVKFHIRVTPPGLGPRSQKLLLFNEYGDRTVVNLSGVGVEPALRLTESTILLPPCAINSFLFTSTVLQNTSTITRQFSFEVTHECVRVSPSCGSLQPGESIPIVLFFYPPLQRVPLSEEIPLMAVSKQSSRKKSNLKMQTPNNASSTTDELTKSDPFQGWHAADLNDVLWCRRKTIRVKCKWGVKDLEECFLALRCSVVKEEVVGMSVMPILGLPEVHPTQVRTKISKSRKRTVVEKPVIAETVELSSPSCAIHLDFGEVPPNRASTRTCFIQNNGSVPTFFQLRPVDPLSPFTLLRLPNEFLQPGEEEAIVVQFKPTDCGSYVETIKFFAQSTNGIDIYVRGSCRRADLCVSLDPTLDANMNRQGSVCSIAFDATLKGATTQVPLYFHNIGTFPLSVSISFGEEMASDWNRRRSFFFQLSPFSVPPRGKVCCPAFFCPQRDGLCKAIATVASGGIEHTITLEGWGCRTNVRCILPDAEPEDTHSPLLRDDCCHPLPTLGMSAVYPLQLRFTKGETKSFCIWSVKGGPSVECTVQQWADVFSASGWVVEPMKLAIAPGTQGVLTVSLRSVDTASEKLATYCHFLIAVKCPSEPACDQIIHVRCAGT